MKVKKTIKDFQQGDVIGKKLSTMPSGDSKIIARSRLVLAHGESGHSHVIEDDEAELLQIGEQIILSLTKAATLKHEEHGQITLSAGIWEIGRVREYDPFVDMTRQVID